MNSNSIVRIRLILFCIFLVALVLVGKLYLLQIVRAKLYSQKVDQQYMKTSVKVFDRGSIFFEARDATHIAAATIKEGYTVSLNPKLIENAAEVCLMLSREIASDEVQCLEKALKNNDPYEEIKKQVDLEKGDMLRTKKIPGLILEKTSWRLYPAHVTAAHTIGFVGTSEGSDIPTGKYGLERAYEAVLTRQSDQMFVNFFAEIFAGIKATVLEKKPLEGDIVTTIEPTVQNYIETVLTGTEKKWRPDEIGAVVLDPKTGEIIAFAAHPTFDPNDRRDIKDPRIFSNPLVENAYEMGSIIKPVTMAIGIDAGVVSATSTYNDQGILTLNGQNIKNSDLKAHGITTMQTVLSKSLNTGAAFVALRVGNERFSEMMFKFGIGEKTGIDLPNEQKGLSSNLNAPRDLEHANASFGQGISLTPIMTARALSVIANGGFLVKPHLVKRIEYSIGGSKNIDPEPGVMVIKKEAAEDVTRMLVKLVDTALRDGKVKLEHYSVAAKTGTAQIADPSTRGYYKDRYLHSFVGYFPAYEPKFLVLLYQVYPKGADYASETLTDPFIDITKFLINYYEIPPDR